MDPSDRVLLSSQHKLTIENLSKLESIIQTYHLHHSHQVSEPYPNTCRSLVIQPMEAPELAVWSLVRDFARPQKYKHFIKSSEVVKGDGVEVGSVRDVMVVSGLPASKSTERLEVLDDTNRVLSFRVIGGDHRLRDYLSVTSVNGIVNEDGRTLTIVMESYAVDIPEGNTAEDTRMFADTIVRLNLQKLADISLKAAACSMEEPREAMDSQKS